MAKKNKNKFLKSFLFLMLVLAIFAGYEFWNNFKNESEQNQTRMNLAETNSPAEKECVSLDVSNYELANINGKILEESADINSDGKDEIIRVYQEAYADSDLPQRSLPIILKIFSGTKDCPKEEFSYAKTKGEDLGENEIGDLQILQNFWGDGREAVMLLTIDTGYGSGATLRLHFFAYGNDRYSQVEGPEFSNLGGYKFNGGVFSGKEIIVADFIWSIGEGHFDSHRYEFTLYKFNGEKYIAQKTGITKNKYMGDIEEMLQKEPEVLIPVNLNY